MPFWQDSFRKSLAQPDDKSIPLPDSKWALEIPFTLYKDLAFLLKPNINEGKIDGSDYLFFIKDVKTDQIISSLVLEFVYPKPEPQFLSTDENILNAGENNPSGTIYFPLKNNKEQVSKTNLVVSKFNAQTNLPDRLVLPHKHNSLLLQFKTLAMRAINHLEYKFKTDSTWKSSAKSERPFIILRDIKPGKHTLQVRYPGQDSGVFEYEFEVRPSWYQTTSFKILLGSFFTVFFFGSIFIVKYRRQQQKLRTENANRKQLQTQIAALRAQLNPHFVFNALNSIQGLVNKNDKEGANLYISKFGSLMRDILEQRDKTTHALAQEIKQLESYLQLEQLRFQFKYKIDTEDSINLVETDFPNLLLQPFVENAIKHGISGKKEKDCIHIRFERNTDNLKVIIQDNGSGFNQAEPSNGYGIRLIKERIAVLNQLYKDQPITYEIQSTPTAGTTVTLTFTKWL